MRRMKNDDGGYILITILLLLLVLTVVGMSAIGTSTIENILSGNTRLRDKNLARAEAGTGISGPVIERAARVQDLSGFTNLINPIFPESNDNFLPTELRTSAFDPDTQDIQFSLDGQTVSVDIDKMYVKYMGGSAIEFASGYEGIGKSGGSGFYTYYRINATGSDLASSSAQVGQIYRYVPK